MFWPAKGISTLANKLAMYNSNDNAMHLFKYQWYFC